MSASTLKKIDEKLGGLDPESLRYRVLTALRDFRASWVNLGRLLTDVAYGGDYKEWGYEDFEVYCARELGLKRPTVKKLMLSYNYMKSYEPNRLEQFEEAEEDAPPPFIPDYQTVDLLHKARQRDDLDEEQTGRLHALAFEGGEEETTLRKELRDHLRPADDETIDSANARRAKELGQILRVARRLRQQLAASRAVPDGLKARIDEALLELESLD